MFHVYIIKDKNGKLYYGCTSNLVKRLDEHNTNQGGYTKNKGPFELVYFEGYKSKDDAFHREHNLKLQANALTGLKRRIRKSIGEAL